MNVLISGASIAGPVLAYWLAQHGIDVTVVERAPALRKTGGHAIDLFRPAMEISERMGVLPQVMAHATGTTLLDVRRPWASRPAHIDYVKLAGTMSDRHVEIMRDDLSEIYYDASRDDAEYLFGDQITAIADDGRVTFAHGGSRRFDVVVGADGLLSGVRQIMFGDVPERFLGGYLSVVSVPKSFAREGEMTGYYEPNRVAMVYTADHLDDARAVFVFRPVTPLAFDYRDVSRQKRQLCDAFTGVSGEVDTWLAEVGRTPAFYFDAITQLEMTTWSKGRVTLVGDAGYCPGPAVGGSTSLAVYGAYVLAGELARAKDILASDERLREEQISTDERLREEQISTDERLREEQISTDERLREEQISTAFAAYEAIMMPSVVGARAFAATTAKTIVPGSRLGVDALVAAGRVISVLPLGVTQALARFNRRGVRLYDTMPLPA